MKKWALLVLWILVLGQIASDTNAGMGLQVGPSRFRFFAPAGRSGTGKVRVENKASYAVRVAVDITDTVTVKDKEGRYTGRDEAPAGSTPYSCAKWIKIISGEGKILRPGESSDVEFIVTPPPNVVSGGYAAYIFFLGEKAVVGAQSTRETLEMVTVPRLGISIFFEVQGAVTRTGKLLDFSVKPPRGPEPLKIGYKFQNTGNADIELTGNFHLLDSRGNLAGKGPITTFRTFPGETSRADTTWVGDLAPGHYTAVVTFELGPNSTEALVKEIEFDVAKR